MSSLIPPPSLRRQPQRLQEYQNRLRHYSHHPRRRRFQQRRQRRQWRHQRFSFKKATFLFVWAIFGCCSYGVVVGWLFLGWDDSSSDQGLSSTSFSTGNHENDESKKSQPIVEIVSAVLGHSEIQKMNDEHSSSRAMNSHKSSFAGEEQRFRARLKSQGFGWMIIPSCLVVAIILSIQHVREEDDTNHDRRRRTILATSIDPILSAGEGLRRHGRRRTYRIGVSPSTLNRLDFINQDRLERGEPIISLDSYLAFQRVLSDRSIWMNLAERYQVQGVHFAASADGNNVGIPPERLDYLCPQWTYKSSTENETTNAASELSTTNLTTNNQACNLMSDEECIICLCQYENKDVLRTLPCQHTFHCHCIDRWFEASMECPMCKNVVVVQNTNAT